MVIKLADKVSTMIVSENVLYSSKGLKRGFQNLIYNNTNRKSFVNFVSLKFDENFEEILLCSFWEFCYK